MTSKEKVIEGSLASFVLAEEQALLAKERTMMSSMRTGLAFIGVGLVVAKFWAYFLYQILATILILMGFTEIYGAKRKMLKYEKRLHKLRKAIRAKDIEKLKKEWFE